MSWKRRLLELSLAGGMVAVTATAGCGDGPNIPLCNANPDPCCAQPNSQACYDYQHADMSVPHDLTPPGDLTATD